MIEKRGKQSVLVQTSGPFGRLAGLQSAGAFEVRETLEFVKRQAAEKIYDD